MTKLPSPATLPPRGKWFRAFELTPFEKVKVVILGQDPYHTPGMANGLAFSVEPNIKKLPPSLRNIFIEYCADLGYEQPANGCLEPWAKSGVLLLNTALTVRVGQANSHSEVGWDVLTKEVLVKLSDWHERLVFILWGKKAQEFEPYIMSPNKHRIMKSAHPSPFSAEQGFFGSKPFSKANAFLRSNGREEVEWKLDARATLGVGAGS